MRTKTEKTKDKEDSGYAQNRTKRVHQDKGRTTGARILRGRGKVAFHQLWSYDVKGKKTRGGGLSHTNKEGECVGGTKTEGEEKKQTKSQKTKEKKKKKEKEITNQQKKQKKKTKTGSESVGDGEGKWSAFCRGVNGIIRRVWVDRMVVIYPWQNEKQGSPGTPG